MELFKAKLGSPITQLADNITNTQTTISLVNADVLPDAPNIATIGTGVNAETIRYSGKTLNTLTGVTRGFTGTAKAWTAGQSIARIFTQYDHDSLVESVGDVATLTTTDKTGTVSAINETDNRVKTHLAEIVTQEITISRDLSLTGVQTVTTLSGRKIKGIIAFINVADTKMLALSRHSENLNSFIYFDTTSGNTRGGSSSTNFIILSKDNFTNRTVGVLQNVTEGSFELNWSVLSGSGVTGTATINMMIIYHD